MKVLYVSDLDGTLLNMDGRLDEEAIKELNRLIGIGINFTVSTGRGESARRILKDINFKLPIMLLNGSINYDFASKKYINEKVIEKSKVQEVINIIKECGSKDIEVQVLEGNEIQRLNANEWNENKKCISLNVLLSEKQMKKLIKVLEKVDGISYYINKKVYAENEWFCDIVPKGISKGSGVLEFKKKYGFDKIIAFGDSGNDLPLAEVADEFYAVENAQDIVKQKATAVIRSCFNNGVIKFICK